MIRKGFNMNRIILSTKFILREIFLDNVKRRTYFRQLKASGFQFLHFDYNKFHPNEILNEKLMTTIFDDIKIAGLEIANTHLFVNPFYNIWSDQNLDKDSIIWSLISKCLYYNKQLKTSDSVYHVPETDRFAIDLCQNFISQFPRLLDISLQYDTILCMENHYNQRIDNFILQYLFTKYNDSLIRMTFDVGHYFISKNNKLLENDFYNRIHLIHMHDNNNVEDQHRIPDIRKQEWDLVLRKLHTNNSVIPFIFELNNNGIQNLDTLYKTLHDIVVYYNQIYIPI